MPFRRLPDTDATRIAAIDALINKAATVPVADRPYPAALHTQLETAGPQFKTEAQQAGTALSTQGAATTQATLDFLALQTLVSHFIQVLNFAITRGIIPREARAHYQLDLGGGVLPDLITQADVTLWAGRITTGEAARLAADPAAVPMAMPSEGEVALAADAYETSSRLQSTAKDAYDDEQGDVATLRPLVDLLIRDIWDHIEFQYRNETGPSRRRKAREWGLTYVTRPGETPDPEEAGTDPTPPTNPAG